MLRKDLKLENLKFWNNWMGEDSNFSLYELLSRPEGKEGVGFYAVVDDNESYRIGSFDFFYGFINQSTVSLFNHERVYLKDIKYFYVNFHFNYTDEFVIYFLMNEKSIYFTTQMVNKKWKEMGIEEIEEQLKNNYSKFRGRAIFPSREKVIVWLLLSKEIEDPRIWNVFDLLNIDGYGTMLKEEERQAWKDEKRDYMLEYQQRYKDLNLDVEDIISINKLLTKFNFLTVLDIRTVATFVYSKLYAKPFNNFINLLNPNNRISLDYDSDYVMKLFKDPRLDYLLDSIETKSYFEFSEDEGSSHYQEPLEQEIDYEFFEYSDYLEWNDPNYKSTEIVVFKFSDYTIDLFNKYGQLHKSFKEQIDNKFWNPSWNGYRFVAYKNDGWIL